MGPLEAAGSGLAGALAAYPHVAACAVCRLYAESYEATHSVQAIIIATLTRHDAAHTTDPLTTGLEHFA